MPQLENALLAGHDIIFLGERGQAKTRMIRSLTGLLDEWMPIVAGSEINDDPYQPVSRHARELVDEHGEDTPIDWVHRDERYGEKLATPDTSIADLIGEVDPIKVAEGRYLSDELTLHYGLVPRTNRGIFAINELPDLAERIQVGLLNVLEERDVQIRGYKIRLPLDVVLVASANPEDYTNRGRIITPLKDRFGSQIRTHYPLDVETEVAIMRQEAPPAVAGDLPVAVPDYMEEIVATLHPPGPPDQPHQPALRRVGPALGGERRGAGGQRRCAGRCAPARSEVVPRVSDLEALAASTSGKIEIETLEDGREGQIVDGHAQGAPCSRCSRSALDPGAASATSSTPSTRASSPTPARTCRRPTRPSWSPASRRCASRSTSLTGGDESPGRGGQPPSSSSSRACTSRSASTRTPAAPGPPTAAGADRS